MNVLGRAREPFLFVINFDCSEFIIEPLRTVNPDEIKYSMNDDFIHFRNYVGPESGLPQSILIQKELIAFELYEQAFKEVIKNLHYGNSFLTNLTVETPISSNYSFEDLFAFARAKYKLLVKDKFLSFSPESFIRITPEGKVSSFPMKGTIEASRENAREIILSDQKEKYEHTTIVDLIRNDLSRICDKVWVDRFRYLDTIYRQDGSRLLQVSSEVCGQLNGDWRSRIGDILLNLLPAGSISGAPKDKTVEIINSAEKYTYLNGGRGFYTGVFGIFDGEKLDSAVLIRFIEKKGNGLVFKSGGGITARSDCRKEYDELISKIYVPIL